MERRGMGDNLGGTMRLGAYDCVLDGDSLARRIYGADTISERHRHRYEVNINYRERLEQAGLVFTGMSPDGLLPEIVELPSHPWYLGVQFHPELKSKPFDPHPLFSSFVHAAIERFKVTMSPCSNGLCDKSPRGSSRSLRHGKVLNARASSLHSRGRLLSQKVGLQRGRFRLVSVISAPVAQTPRGPAGKWLTPSAAQPPP